ncbi:MAG: DNA repair and recombination protein RadA [Candidatus Woesearchaeota archaeon]|nr:DNA repair and recombination protein RadA [Candidatus Woesearchaeota archaeon]
MEQEVIMEEEITKAPEQDTVKDMTVMDLPGVGAATAEKLENAGYDDLMSIAVASPGEIVNASGVSESVGRKLIQAARASLEMGFTSGEDLMKKRETVEKISTNVQDFDRILGGGFETGCITECFGQYGSCKTQIAHQLAVNVVAQDPEGVTVFIDTENTFRPERIKQFAEGKELDGDEVLKNIRVAKAYNSDHQMLLAEKVEELIKDGVKVKAVVVDSLTAHFRAEFVGRGTLAERQQKINKHMRVLSKLADRYNIVVYVTNQVMAKPDAFFGDPTEAIGGHIVGHNSTFRVYLRRGKKGTRVAKLVDAPNMPDDEAVFMVTETGIIDV